MIMNFKDIVESNRPKAKTDEENISYQNKEICDFVIAGVKESILGKARNCPNDGTPLQIDGDVYLGTLSDDFMRHIVTSSTHEIRSFFSFLSNNKTTQTKFELSSNGEALLRMMRSVGEQDNIVIVGYQIGFGDTARSDNDDIEVYIRGKRLTNLFMVHKHSLPVDVKYTDHDLSAYFLSPETNGMFKRYSDHRIPGLYVQYRYLG